MATPTPRPHPTTGTPSSTCTSRSSGRQPLTTTGRGPGTLIAGPLLSSTAMMRLSAILCIAAVVLLAGAPESVGDHPPTARTAVVATAVSPAPTTPPGSTCPG